MLAVECCRRAFAGGDSAKIGELADQVDWRRFNQTARRHRVQGHAWRVLRTLPTAIPEDRAGPLAEDAARIAEQNLRAVRQSALLLETFTGASLPLLFIKGLTLGKLAWPDPLTKMSWDLDVLIAPDQAAAAAAQLNTLDYRLAVPDVPPDSASFERWHRRRKESVWVSPDGVHLELHTRLADSPDLIAGIDVRSPAQWVEVAPQVLLPTLGPDELFAYLCVHGASSAWFRLKWIADLAALVHGSSPGRIEQLYQRSQSLGAGRAAAQALLLADRAFGTLAGSDLAAGFSRSFANRWLAETAWSQMTREREPTSVFLGTAAIHVSQLFLLPGAGFKRRELWRQVSDAVRRTG